ncbi:hypothetical protein CICLE_v10033271mg [Citrus x clementina]|uniref:Uncharacterized protein n=2 Tax=Citrus TaxID=2706 RepID=A0A067DQR7_CITSI|nr:hypothetical protein CICLE_v10033271mg [Citrus x clementina]KDO45173.1 hypothetical protein CISIN_1g041210mg [Citrus sinensis]
MQLLRVSASLSTSKLEAGIGHAHRASRKVKKEGNVVHWSPQMSLHFRMATHRFASSPLHFTYACYLF